MTESLRAADQNLTLGLATTPEDVEEIRQRLQCRHAFGTERLPGAAAAPNGARHISAGHGSQLIKRLRKVHSDP